MPYEGNHFVDLTGILIGSSLGARGSSLAQRGEDWWKLGVTGVDTGDCLVIVVAPPSLT